MNEAINKKYLQKIDNLNKKYLGTYKNEEYVEDNECYHIAYDDIILDLVRELGYEEIAKSYESASRYFWYA